MKNYATSPIVMRFFMYTNTNWPHLFLWLNFAKKLFYMDETKIKNFCNSSLILDVFKERNRSSFIRKCILSLIKKVNKKLQEWCYYTSKQCLSNISYNLLIFHPNTEVIVSNLSNKARSQWQLILIQWWYCVLDNFRRNNWKGLHLEK